MIDEKAIEHLAASADMIVSGYTFTQKEEGKISGRSNTPSRIFMFYWLWK